MWQMKIWTMVMLWSLVLLSAGYYQKKSRCQFLSTSCPSCLWWGSQGQGLTFSQCKALVWVLFLPLLAIFPNIHSYCPKTCIVSLCFTMHSMSFILLFAAIFPGINSYILSQNMHSFTMFHHAEHEFYPPFCRNISWYTFILTPNIVFSTNKCPQSSPWGSETSWRLQESNLAPRIHSGFCSKSWEIVIIERSAYRLWSNHHFHLKVNLLFIEIIVTFVTLCCAKQIKLLLRLKTGLHQATLTLAEPLQGPQVGKWKQWNVCNWQFQISTVWISWIFSKKSTRQLFH